MDQKAIDQIKENTKIAEDILFKVIKSIKPGITTYEVDQIAKQEFEKNEVLPSANFLSFPHYISISINEDVIFGKISKKKKVQEGDVVKLTLGIFKNGYFTDLGFTLIAGNGSSLKRRRLIEGTAMALYNATQNLKSGVTVREISSIIENALKQYNLNPVSEIMGHGIGRNLHEPPFIPNCEKLSFIDYNLKFCKNAIVCIEPVATSGNSKVNRKNKISFITKDKESVAHFEFPVLIKDKGIEILGKKIFEHIRFLKEFREHNTKFE